MKDEILAVIYDALGNLEIELPEDAKGKITVTYPDPQLGDYSTNAALILAKSARLKPQDLALQIIEKLDRSKFESVDVAGPGFINFKLKVEDLIQILSTKF